MPSPRFGGSQSSGLFALQPATASHLVLSRPEADCRTVYVKPVDQGEVDALDDLAGWVADRIRRRRWKLVVYHGVGMGELYDLEADPQKFANL